MSEEMYLQELIDEYYNAIQELHEALDDKDQQITDLQHEKEVLQKALELACKDVHDLTQNQTGVELCYECEHFDLCNKLSNIDKLDLECEQVFAHAYKTKAKEMLENE